MGRFPVLTGVAAVLLSPLSGAASPFFSFGCQAEAAEIGGTATVTWSVAAVPRGGNVIVAYFGATEGGSTTVQLAGRNVVIPAGGIVWQAGFSMLSGTSGTAQISIPTDPNLVGHCARLIAVVMDESTGQILAIARAGGPIIQDAIC